jgi:ABC-type sugar transport system ATPase subunit
MIHVTHDQGEALALGSRIAVLKEGRIVQCGAPLDVYEHPTCRFVGEFIGSPAMSILPCLVDTTGPATRIRIDGAPDEMAWELAEGDLRAASVIPPGVRRVDLGLRAEHVRVLDHAAVPEGALVARSVVRRLELHGADTVATVAVGLHTLSVRLAAHAAIRVGEPLAVALDPAGIVWFDPDSGLALC